MRFVRPICFVCPAFATPTDDETMAYREFRDRHGVPWHVWEVRAHDPGTGWLAFESKFEKRRLRPIPPGWTREPEQALERLLDEATPAPIPRRLIG